MRVTTGNIMTMPLNITTQSYQGAIALQLEQVVYSGVSESTGIIKFAVNNKSVMNTITDAKTLFDNYYSRWEQETSFCSRGDLVFSNPNYIAIVEMGKDAIPFIKEKIQNKPDPIVNALRDITGENIIDRSIVSKIKGFTSLKRACKLWLKQLKKCE